MGTNRRTVAGRAVIALGLGLSIGPVTVAQVGQPPLEPWEMPDGTIMVDEHVFGTWHEYLTSPLFLATVERCGTVTPKTVDEAEVLARAAGGGTADCSLSATNPDTMYDPAAGLFRIPVVVHVIKHTDGSGDLTVSQVQSQIDILNEDFQAMLGTNGENGTDAGIEFFLATEDPGGLPTNGITYSTNDTWFDDAGSYWNTLAWDPNRYLNIYTNNPLGAGSGVLGYVPSLPQSGGVGASADRVVILYTSFGRNAPLAPYDQGRTTTHEVGHYLGLFHVFEECDAASCYTSGDRICDTGSQQTPNFDCTNGGTCGQVDDFRNYMDYTEDLCMDHFSSEQNYRMRCTLEHWRPDLAAACASPPSPDCNNNCVLDSDEIMAGTVPDCNANGIPDTCDLAGASLDCNDNLVPDECEDCNGNGIADPCEFISSFDDDSGPLMPFGFFTDVSYTIPSPPAATGDVTLSFEALGNYNFGSDNAVVSLNGMELGTLFDGAGASNCPTVSGPEQIILSALDYNTLVAGGDAMFNFHTEATFLPEDCGGTWISVATSYEGTAGATDSNGNGVPDECDLARGDNDLDGDVDIDDLLNLLAEWGLCPAPCPEDTDLDGDVDINDLLNLLAGWG